MNANNNYSSTSSSSITKYGKVLPILGLIYFVVTITLDYIHKEGLSIPSDLNGGLVKDGSSSSKRASSSSSEHDSLLFDYNEESKITTLDSSVEAITARLQPRRLQLHHDKATSHQILHLHNMKTAGTSIDRRLNCAIKRMIADYNITIPRYSIHECWRRVYRECIANATNPCREEIKDAAVMSFCGPLEKVEMLGWAGTARPEVAVVTMLRHPVDRVWSQYKYQLSNCYRCKDLTYIYKLFDSGDWPGYDNLCMSHLKDKQVRNLVSKDLPADATDEERLQDAIANMKSKFTLVGITEQMEATEALLINSFPWLAEHLDGSNATCSMEHTNTSPKNNGCWVDKATKKMMHMPVSKHPDEETRKVIIEHNQLDMKLYEAALEHFEVLKNAIGFEG